MKKETMKNPLLLEIIQAVNVAGELSSIRFIGESPVKKDEIPPIPTATDFVSATRNPNNEDEYLVALNYTFGERKIEFVGKVPMEQMASTFILPRVIIGEMKYPDDYIREAVLESVPKTS